MMEYKGYVGKSTYDDKAQLFHGQVINLKDIITFQGKNVDELTKAFQDSVDDYLSWRDEQDKLLMSQIKPHDIWQHYKGKQYRIIAVSCDSEDLTWYVVYETLYDNPVSRIWHRPLEMFLGTLEIDGAIVPRFMRIRD